MGLQPVRGTKDIYGEDAVKFRYLQNLFFSVAQRFGCRELATPIFEFTDVFQRTLGDVSDIVTKEMYTFLDRGGDSLTLRPEGTAGAVRCLLSEGLIQELPLKWMYAGPMFRYERPQRGRQRQFYQVGVEFLGFDSPLSDVECICVGFVVLKQLGLIDKTTLHLNSIGDHASRQHYRQKLVDYLTPFSKELSAESQMRLKANPLRILDSKDPVDQKLTEEAPQLSEFLSPHSQAFFTTVQQTLSQLNISYQINPHLVRGLDYYCHSVFEFRTTELGAQDAVLAGGRYDSLVETMGGPATPAVGWAAGLERLALLIPRPTTKDRPVSLIPLGEAAMTRAMSLSLQLRSEGLAVDLSFTGNLSKRMKKANRAGCKWALVFGDNELHQNVFQLKNFDTGEQKVLSLMDCLTMVKSHF